MKKNIFRLMSVLLIALWIVPIVWMMFSALISSSVFTGSSEFNISSLTFSNFGDSLQRKDWLQGLANSIGVMSISTLLIIAVAGVFSYGLSRSPRDHSSILLWLYSTRILPPAVLIVPFLLIFRLLDLVDTWAALIIANFAANLGFFVLLIKSYLDQIDKGFEEVLRSQGYNRWQAFLVTFLSKGKMQLASTIVICILLSWNEFIFASTFTAGGRSQTLPVLVTGFITGQDVMWGPMFASCSLLILPAILTVWFVEKALLRGFTIGKVDTEQ